MARRLKLGLLGVGRRGKTHLSAIQGLADLYELVALCDANEASVRATGSRLGLKGYTDVEEFFSRERLEVVDIVTPAESHHLMARVAARHGAHMLIETPLAPSRAMMDFIGEAAARAGVEVEVAENFRRHPETRLNRKALDAGVIGKVLRVTSFYEPIGQYGCYHLMSLLRFYAGAAVDEVRGFARQFPVERVEGYSSLFDTETWTQASLSFANGVAGSCTYLSTWLTPLRQRHPHFTTVEGTAGFIAAGRREANTIYKVEHGAQAAYPMRTEGRREAGQEIPTRFYYETHPPLEYPNPFAARPLNYADDWGAADVIAIADALTSLHQAVTGGRAPEYGSADARLDQELSIAIGESARLQGQPVRLPLREETAWEREQHERFRAQWGGDPFKDADRLIAANFSDRRG